MTETIHIIPEDRKPETPRVWEAIACLAGALSMAAMLFPFMSGGTDFIIVFAAGAAAVLVCSLARERGFIRLMFAAALIGAAAVMFGSFSKGMLSFINKLIFLWNTRFEASLMQFSADASRFDCLVFFAIAEALGVVAAHTLCVWKKTIGVCAAVFICFELMCLLRVQQSALNVVVVLAAIAVFWSLCMNPLHVYARNIFIAIAITVISGTVFGLALSDFNGSYRVGTLKETIKTEAHDIRYNSDTLPDGDMKRAYLMADGDSPTLSVTSYEDHEEYLAGFVGARFSDGKWMAHDQETLTGEWNGLFRWLSENGFRSQTQYAAYDSAPNKEVFVEKIENTGADRSYIYVPRSLSDISDTRFSVRNDLSVKARGLFGAGKYELAYADYPGAENLIVKISSDSAASSYDAASEYSRAQNVYGGFVSDIYTSIDDNTAELINEVFFSSDNLSDDAGLYSIISRIRAVLELRANYSESPPRYTGEKDFIEWFLNDAGSGNSAYFATAAVMALRAAGYCARYAEGYYSPWLQSGTTVLTDRDAHAWAEVYSDTAGWIPVEATPGFYSTRLIGRQTVEVSRDSAGNGMNENSEYDLTEEYDSDLPEEESETRESPVGVGDVAAFMLAAAVLFALVLIIRRAVVSHIRKCRFECAEPEGHLYDYIFHIFKLCGIECDRTAPYKCRDAVCSHFEEILPEEYDRMVAIMQKSVFGQQKLRPLELRSLKMFAEKLVGLAEKNQNKFKLLILKYWRLL